MTELLEQAVARLGALSAETQDEFARLLLRLAGDDAIYKLCPEEEADLMAAEGEVARGAFATDADVEAVFSQYRL